VSDGGSTLRLLKVTESDVGIFQCNASNDHGYIFANVHLTVEGQCIAEFTEIHSQCPKVHSSEGLFVRRFVVKTGTNPYS